MRQTEGQLQSGQAFPAAFTGAGPHQHLQDTGQVEEQSAADVQQQTEVAVQAGAASNAANLVQHDHHLQHAGQGQTAAVAQLRKRARQRVHLPIGSRPQQHYGTDKSGSCHGQLEKGYGVQIEAMVMPGSGNANAADEGGCAPEQSAVMEVSSCEPQGPAATSKGRGESIIHTSADDRLAQQPQQAQQAQQAQQHFEQQQPALQYQGVLQPAQQAQHAWQQGCIVQPEQEAKHSRQNHLRPAAAQQLTPQQQQPANCLPYQQEAAGKQEQVCHQQPADASMQTSSTAGTHSLTRAQRAHPPPLQVHGTQASACSDSAQHAFHAPSRLKCTEEPGGCDQHQHQPGVPAEAGSSSACSACVLPDHGIKAASEGPLSGLKAENSIKFRRRSKFEALKARREEARQKAEVQALLGA